MKRTSMTRKAVPGLGDICALMGVDAEPEVHTAANGVTVTGLALKELFKRAECPIPTIAKAAA